MTTPDFLTVGLDGSAAAERALGWAIAEARRRSMQLQIVSVWRTPLVTAGPSSALAVPLMVQSAQLYAQHVVDAAAKRAADAGVAATTEVLEGHPTTELLRLAQGSDQLVVGDRGTSAVGRFLLGSVSTAATHYAPVPVTVVRGRQDATHRRVVVGVDGSSASAAALRRAAVEAVCSGAELLVVAAWQLLDVELLEGFSGRLLPQVDDARQWAETRATQLIDHESASLRDCNVRLDVVHEHPVPALLDAASRADLLVVGTRGGGFFDRMLLGSVSSACLHHADCPVQVVPHR